MTTEISAVTAAAAPRGDGLFDVSAQLQAPVNPPPAPVASSSGQPRQEDRTPGERKQAPAAAATEPSAGTLEALVEEMASSAAEAGAAVTFRVDRDLNRVVVSVIDRADGTVLRQIPSEEALRIARNLRQGHSGLLGEVA